MLRGRVRRVGPEDELTLVEHLDELRTRLIVTVATLTVAIAACFWKSEQILHFLRGPIDDRQFIALSPLDPFMASLSISIYCGILITLPVATYQFYAFIIPAFSEEYHRALRPLILMIPALFIVGVVFAWQLVVPPALHFLVNVQQRGVHVQLRASNYVQFLVWMLAAFGLIFELPVVMLMLAKVGLVTSDADAEALAAVDRVPGGAGRRPARRRLHLLLPRVRRRCSCSMSRRTASYDSSSAPGRRKSRTSIRRRRHDPLRRLGAAGRRGADPRRLGRARRQPDRSSWLGRPRRRRASPGLRRAARAW